VEGGHAEKTASIWRQYRLGSAVVRATLAHGHPEGPRPWAKIGGHRLAAVTSSRSPNHRRSWRRPRSTSQIL